VPAVRPEERESGQHDDGLADHDDKSAARTGAGLAAARNICVATRPSP
jgi:hypothetical protein